MEHLAGNVQAIKLAVMALAFYQLAMNLFMLAWMLIMFGQQKRQ